MSNKLRIWKLTAEATEQRNSIRSQHHSTSGSLGRELLAIDARDDTWPRCVTSTTLETYLFPLTDVLPLAVLEEALVVWDTVLAVYKAVKRSVSNR
jgi:hypothetical protein